MRNTILLAAVIFALGALRALGATPEEVFRIASRSVVVVQVYDDRGRPLASGSGVVIEPDRVATNCHVVRPEGVRGLRIYRAGAGNNLRNAYIEQGSEGADVCILRVRNLVAPPARGGSAAKLRVGQSVYAIGAPRGLELTLSGGLVSALRTVRGELFVQTDAAISPGSSGGGLFDSTGSLIGITTFFVQDGQNLNFAIPIDRVLKVAGSIARPRPPIAQHRGPEEWKQEADELRERKDWKALQALGSAWAAVAPGSTDALTALADAYAGLGQSREELETLQRIADLRPNDARAWFRLATERLRAEQIGAGAAALEKAVDTDPKLAAAWQLLFYVYLQLSRPSDAERAFNTLSDLDPKLARETLNAGDPNVLAAARSVARDRWTKLGAIAERGTAYYDRTRVRAQGDALRVWLLMSFPEPVARAPWAKPHQSQLWMIALDCRHDRWSGLFISTHATANGEGPQVEARELAGTNPSTITPNSPFEVLSREVCK